MSRTSLLLGFALLLSGAGPLVAQPGPDASFESRVVTQAPLAVTSFGAAVTDGWLYVLGGARGRPHHYDRLSQAPLFCRLDLRGEQDWQMLLEPTPAQGLALVAHGGKLYRIGGMRSLNEPGTKQELTSVKNFERFDPATLGWSTLPELPEGRSSHDAVVLDGRIYVVGGWTLDGGSKGAEWLDTVLSIDPAAETPEWKVVSETPFRRRALCVAAHAGRLYAIGGITESGKTSRSVDILELATGHWSEGPDLPEDGFGFSAFAVNGRIVGSGSTGTVWSLRPGADVWTAAGELGFGRFFHRIVPDGGEGLYVVGGSGQRGRVRHVEHLVPGADPTGPRVQTFEVPHPGASKNRQGMLLDGNRLVFFGGNNSVGQHDFKPHNFVDECWELDLATLMVKRRESFPEARQSMQTVPAGSRRRPAGFVLGGFGHDGEVARSFGSVHHYDVRRDQWRVTPVTLPAPRSQAGVVMHDDSIWIFGGLDYDPRRPKKQHFKHVEEVICWKECDEASGFEDTGIRLRSPRRAFGGALLDGRYYLVGGMKAGFKLVEGCEAFDFETKTWIGIPAPSSTRLNPQMVALNGRLFLAGGTARNAKGKLAPAESIETYDPVARRWTTLIEKLPVPARHVRMFAHEGQLVLVSMHDAKESVIRVAFVDPNLARPAPRAPASRPASRPVHER